jgi:hypothetical protein
MQLDLHFSTPRKRAGLPGFAARQKPLQQFALIEEQTEPFCVPRLYSEELANREVVAVLALFHSRGKFYSVRSCDNG